MYLFDHKIIHAGKRPCNNFNNASRISWFTNPSRVVPYNFTNMHYLALAELRGRKTYQFWYLGRESVVWLSIRPENALHRLGNWKHWKAVNYWLWIKPMIGMEQRRWLTNNCRGLRRNVAYGIILLDHLNPLQTPCLRCFPQRGLQPHFEWVQTTQGHTLDFKIVYLKKIIYKLYNSLYNSQRISITNLIGPIKTTLKQATVPYSVCF